MSLERLILDQRRLIYLLASALALAGLVAWFVMPRQEDPTFPNRNGLVIAPLPGADAERVERLVVEPIEDALADVEGIEHIRATARAGVAVMSVQLDDTIAEPDPYWDDVEERLLEVQADLPDAALPIRIDNELTRLQSVMVAITGSDDRLALRQAAETLTDELRRIRNTREVTVTPDPGEQITVRVDDAAVRRYGLSKGQLAQQIGIRTTIVPGGRVVDGGRTVVVDPRSDFADLDALEGMPIALASGSSVPLAQLADVRYEPTQPAEALMRLNGQTAVAVGVNPRSGIDVVSFGEEVQATLDRLRPELAPLTLTVVTNQPMRVEGRLGSLGGSLLQGALIVGLVLFAAMGLRLGGVVASVVPLVTLSSLAIYALNGGILQQISVAALVLSLGLLVDNAIVVAERVQARIDEGESGEDAASGTVRELAWPLFTATGTTLASFVPLLLSEGPSGDFTRAIPQLVMLTLVVSFFFAITVTPMLAAQFFKPNPRRTFADSPLLSRLSQWPTQFPWTTVGGATALVFGVLLLLPFVQQQFFPAGDRNQAVFTLELAEGSHLEATSDVAADFERALLQRPEVTQVASFVGRSTPPFYYNLLQRPQAPHVAQLLVTTRSTADVEPLLAWARQQTRDLAGVAFIARKLEQGPPLEAPLEYRLVGDDVVDLWNAANALHQVLRGHDATTDVRHNLGQGTPTLAMAVIDEATSFLGIAPATVAQAVLSQTRGLPAGSLWTEAEPIDIVVRSRAGERFALADLPTVDVWSPKGPAPLANFASTAVEFRPTVLHRRDRQRIATVAAQLRPGFAFNQVAGELRPKVDEIVEAYDLELQIGGEAEGSESANTAILVAAPMGGLLLILFLLAQFSSFRRVTIVLATVPLAATGVIPGLVISGQPFGFTSLLGVFALIGIVVNNAIILIDWIDQRRKEGLSIKDAVSDAVIKRMRPILLTTLTTIVGMLPLLFSSSTLWPPLASALISGLVASTGLTLLVVPALYMLTFRNEMPNFPPGVRPALAMGLALLLVPATTEAAPRTVDLATAMDAAAERPSVQAAAYRDSAAAAETQAAFGQAFLPAVSGSVTATRREADLVLDVPDAPIEILQTPQDTIEGAAVLQVSVLAAGDWARWQAARAQRNQRTAEREATTRDARLAAANACLDQWDLTAAIQALTDQITALEQQAQRVEALRREGRALKSDALQIEVARLDAVQQRFALEQQQDVAQVALAAATGAETALTCVKQELALPDLLPDRADRPEQGALDAAITAVRRQRTALRGDALPTVSLEGRFSGTNNQVLVPNTWLQGSVVAAWTPVARGARQAQDRALTRQVAALRADRDELDRQFTVAWASAQAQYRVAQEAVPVRDAALEQAQEALRLVEAQYAAGRATIIDVLQLQAAASRQQADRDRARHRLIRTYLALRHALGASVTL
ncbi:MAG: efflux RND transporter permease subunit [Myxococcota bacterium]